MNIAMEQTEEYVNGQLKNKYGDAFIRGNNGNYVSIISLFFSLVLPPRENNWIFYICINAVLYISTTKRNVADGA